MVFPFACHYLCAAGQANLAASSFFSGIIREPLNGVEAILPVRMRFAIGMPHRALLRVS